jgi:hypothetical protein
MTKRILSATAAMIAPAILAACRIFDRLRGEFGQDALFMDVDAIPVIPILLDGTRMPKQLGLPLNLQPLSERNGLDVGHASFHTDMDKLIGSLKGKSTSGDNADLSQPSIERRPEPNKLGPTHGKFGFSDFNRFEEIFIEAISAYGCQDRRATKRHLATH